MARYSGSGRGKNWRATNVAIKPDILSVLDKIRAKWVRQYGRVEADKLEISLMPMIKTCFGHDCDCLTRYLNA
jgi:hypothetical protein